MQEETKTAGKTAQPTNRFEEEICRLNEERNSRINEIKELQQEIINERETLKEQKQQHYDAIEAIDQRLADLKDASRTFHQEIADIRAEYKQRKAQVMEESDAWFREHPGDNWLWKKVYSFFKKNPDICARIMAEEGGEL